MNTKYIIKTLNILIQLFQSNWNNIHLNEDGRSALLTSLLKLFKYNWKLYKI